MVRKLLPVLLILVGIGSGIGAGIAFKPQEVPDLAANPCGDVTDATNHKNTAEKAPEHADEPLANREYMKLSNQFVVPVVQQDRIQALVVMSLSVEIVAGEKEVIYAREPKLRDAFLQVMFDHANMGGFSGAFTNSNNMDVLRGALKEVARKAMGDIVSDVLIVEIARQDV